MYPFDEELVASSRRAISRRRFVKLAALATAAPGVLGRSTWAATTPAFPEEERSLALYNTHTGESLKTVYWIQGEYLSEALAEIDYVLRDHRADAVKSMDTRLLDLLHEVGRQLETRQPFHIISGYRSPATNALLRRRGAAVARHSMHMEGKAADIRIPGQDLSMVCRLAMRLQGGGVGRYPRSDFVHVDVGRVRYW